mmetsp:Transcript_12113/g.56219  ORF Transcript_12113/g.56219 Transcript_12113/m.56219 type:complete len:275 (+) Transcript_12113:1089-1913(+)
MKPRCHRAMSPSHSSARSSASVAMSGAAAPRGTSPRCMNDLWYRVYRFAHPAPRGNEVAGRSHAAAKVTLRRSPGASVNAALTAHADSGPAETPPLCSFAAVASSPSNPPASSNGRQNFRYVESASPKSYIGSTVTLTPSSSLAATATPPCHGSDGVVSPYTTSSVCMCAPTMDPRRSNAACVSLCGASLHAPLGGPTSMGATSVVARTFSKLNAMAMSAGSSPSFTARKRKTPTGMDASRYPPGVTGENCVCDSRTLPPAPSADGSYSYHDRG